MFVTYMGVILENEAHSTNKNKQRKCLVLLVNLKLYLNRSFILHYNV